MKRCLGQNTRFVARCLYALAYVTGDSEKEEQLLQRSLKTAEKTLGSEDQFVSVVLNQIGNFYMGQGRLSKGRTFSASFASDQRKTVGANNIYNAVTLLNLGMIARQKKGLPKSGSNISEGYSNRGKCIRPRESASRNDSE